MDSLQNTFKTFIESTCTKFGCTEMIAPLQEGFSALCEAENVNGARPVDVAEKLVERVIRYLINEKGYYVVAHETHRYIDSDGWFELEFNLRGGSDPNTDVYLNTHSDTDQDFEDEWLNHDSDEELGYDAIMWDPYTLHDYAYALENIIECDATRNDLPPELVSECVTFLQGNRYLKDFDKSKCTDANKPLQEGLAAMCEAEAGGTAVEIPVRFTPATNVQAKVDAKLRQLGIVVDWSTYEPSRNRSWASQGMPSGTAEAYTVSEAEEAGSYTTYNKRTICFYVSVSELARTPVEMYDVNDHMGSDYREIGVDTRFVPAGETER